MKKVFLTFGDSSLKASADRIKKQAEAMLTYDKIYITNESQLTEDFRNKFQDKLKKDVKGFGYWCWKPKIILQALNSMDMGDILHYADIGCHLRVQGRQRLLEYFDICESSNSGILGLTQKFIGNVFFDNRFKKDDYSVLERFFNKGDLLDHFGVRNNKEIVDDAQLASGIIFLKKTPLSMALVTMWLKTYYNDFSLADDSPSISPNLKGFIRHGHDQAIWSILAKLNNAELVSFWETQYPLEWSKERGIIKNDYDLMTYYPIWAIRDKQ
jgi:hypothetical protein